MSATSHPEAAFDLDAAPMRIGRVRLIARKLKGLDDVVSVSVVQPELTDQGWRFGDGTAADRDTLNGATWLHEIYTRADRRFTGRATVPVLWDRRRGTLVNNESAEIVRMFNRGFGALADGAMNLYPAELPEQRRSQMAQYKIAVLVGSLRRESLNAKLAAALARLAPQELDFTRVRIGDLPPYNQDDDASQAPQVVRMKGEIAAAQAVLFVTPEYNRSIPGVLKNALDHGSRPYGKSVWAGKPAGVVGISPGAVGTAAAQQHLRNILAYLDMPTLGQPEVFLQAKEGLFNADGTIGEASRGFLQGWMDRYVAFVKHNAG